MENPPKKRKHLVLPGNSLPEGGVTRREGKRREWIVTHAPLWRGPFQPTRSSVSTYKFEIGLKHFFQFLSIGIGEGFSKHWCWRVFFSHFSSFMFFLTKKSIRGLSFSKFQGSEFQDLGFSRLKVLKHVFHRHC